MSKGKLILGINFLIRVSTNYQKALFTDSNPFSYQLVNIYAFIAVKKESDAALEIRVIHTLHMIISLLSLF